MTEEQIEAKEDEEWRESVTAEYEASRSHPVPVQEGPVSRISKKRNSRVDEQAVGLWEFFEITV